MAIGVIADIVAFAVSLDSYRGLTGRKEKLFPALAAIIYQSQLNRIFEKSLSDIVEMMNSELVALTNELYSLPIELCTFTQESYDFCVNPHKILRTFVVEGRKQSVVIRFRNSQ